MMRRMRGFTLIEVLAALAIFAVMMMSMLQISQLYTKQIGQAQDRTLAHFVAMNTAAEIEIEQQWVNNRVVEQVEQQGLRWQVEQQAQATVYPTIQKISIKVSKIMAKDQISEPLYELTMFNTQQQAGAL